MLSVIIGGAGSGKSAFAEDLVCRLPGQRLYIATMTAKDAESLRRIAKHREARAGRGFQTLERGLNLAGAVECGDGIPKRANVLLEDLSNLLANEMFHSDVPFRCEHDGMPRLFVADRTGHLLTNYYISMNKDRDTLDRFYVPYDDYQFEIKDFNHHDTVVGMIMK